jgi:hypothetical protein
MNNRIFINTNTYLRLLFMVPAVCLLGFTGCSSVDAGAEKALNGKMDPQLRPGMAPSDNVCCGDEPRYRDYDVRT